ncbi:NAD(P)H-quinone oxidoreductase [Aurantivibrio plasticivorans]
MRYINLDGRGDASVMRIAEGDKPELLPGEVLIEVRAAGVNRPDVAQRMGLYPPPPDASPVLGLEASGVVVALGEGVGNEWLNTPVCALTNGGAYAEFVKAPVGQCLPIPQGLTFEEAAAIPETFFTVWSNVFHGDVLKPGQYFLVHGGSSGIGSTAIQLAKSLGAQVFTTAGSIEKCRFCESIGADLAVNYKEQDFVATVLETTRDYGVDVILDMVGGDYIAKNIQIAAIDGHVINIAFLGGAKAEVNFAPVMMKRLTLTGSTLRPRSAEYKAQIASELLQRVWPLLEEGKIKPIIYQSFPFSEVVAAHQLMETSQHMGKIVLTLD